MSSQPARSPASPHDWLVERRCALDEDLRRLTGVGTTRSLQRPNRFQASNRFYAASLEFGRALKTEFVQRRLAALADGLAAAARSGIAGGLVRTAARFPGPEAVRSPGLGSARRRGARPW